MTNIPGILATGTAGLAGFFYVFLWVAAGCVVLAIAFTAIVRYTVARRPGQWEWYCWPMAVIAIALLLFSLAGTLLDGDFTAFIMLTAFGAIAWGIMYWLKKKRGTKPTFELYLFLFYAVLGGWIVIAILAQLTGLTHY